MHGARWEPRNDWERWVMESHTGRCPRVALRDCADGSRLAELRSYDPHRVPELVKLPLIPAGGYGHMPHHMVCTAPSTIALEVVYRISGPTAVLEAVLAMPYAPPCPLRHPRVASCPLCVGHDWLTFEWATKMYQRMRRLARDP